MNPAPPAIALDHLVVAAASLDAGADWCEATFGVAPVAGGRHAVMGTHNLVLSVASPRFPRAYLEIIAIDPAAAAPARPRWFDLDTAALRASVATRPRLVHWVARTDDLAGAAALLRAAGHEPGSTLAAERLSPRGLLRWQILVRDDGARLAGGAVPLLISWAGAHPADALPASGVALERLEASGLAAGLAERLGATTGAGAALAAGLGVGARLVELASPR